MYLNLSIFILHINSRVINEPTNEKKLYRAEKESNLSVHYKQ